MDLGVKLIMMILMRLFVLDTIYSAAFNKMSNCTSLYAPKLLKRS